MALKTKKALAKMLRALTAYEEKVENRRILSENHEEDGQIFAQFPTEASVGLGRLLSDARAATNRETVGALLAAFAARGNLIFDMSHATAVLPLTQTVAYLQENPIFSSKNNKGHKFSTIHDCVYRNQLFEEMNFWTFTSSHKIVSNKSNGEFLDDANDESQNIGN